MKGEVVRALDCESVWSCPNILERIFLLTVWTGLNGHQSQSRFSLRCLQGGQLCEHAFLLLHVIFQHNDFDRLHELCAIYYMPIWLESPAYTWDSRSISSDHGSTSSRFIPRPVRTWSINFASVLKQWMKANGCVCLFLLQVLYELFLRQTDKELELDKEAQQTPQLRPPSLKEVYGREKPSWSK